MHICSLSIDEIEKLYNEGDPELKRLERNHIRYYTINNRAFLCLTHEYEYIQIKCTECKIKNIILISNRYEPEQTICRIKINICCQFSFIRWENSDDLLYFVSRSKFLVITPPRLNCKVDNIDNWVLRPVVAYELMHLYNNCVDTESCDDILDFTYLTSQNYLLLVFKEREMNEFCLFNTVNPSEPFFLGYCRLPSIEICKLQSYDDYPKDWFSCECHVVYFTNQLKNTDCSYGCLSPEELSEMTYPSHAVLVKITEDGRDRYSVLVLALKSVYNSQGEYLYNTPLFVLPNKKFLTKLACRESFTMSDCLEAIDDILYMSYQHDNKITSNGEHLAINSTFASQFHPNNCENIYVPDGCFAYKIQDNVDVAPNSSMSDDSDTTDEPVILKNARSFDSLSSEHIDRSSSSEILLNVVPTHDCNQQLSNNGILVQEVPLDTIHFPVSSHDSDCLDKLRVIEEAETAPTAERSAGKTTQPAITTSDLIDDVNDIDKSILQNVTFVNKDITADNINDEDLKNEFQACLKDMYSSDSSDSNAEGDTSQNDCIKSDGIFDASQLQDSSNIMLTESQILTVSAELMKSDHFMNRLSEVIAKLAIHEIQRSNAEDYYLLASQVNEKLNNLVAAEVENQLSSMKSDIMRLSTELKEAKTALSNCVSGHLSATCVVRNVEPKPKTKEAVKSDVVDVNSCNDSVFCSRAKMNSFTPKRVNKQPGSADVTATSNFNELFDILINTGSDSTDPTTDKKAGSVALTSPHKPSKQGLDDRANTDTTPVASSTDPSMLEKVFIIKPNKLLSIKSYSYILSEANDGYKFEAVNIYNVIKAVSLVKDSSLSKSLKLCNSNIFEDQSRLVSDCCAFDRKYNTKGLMTTLMTRSHSVLSLPKSKAIISMVILNILLYMMSLFKQDDINVKKLYILKSDLIPDEPDPENHIIEFPAVLLFLVKNSRLQLLKWLLAAVEYLNNAKSCLELVDAKKEESAYLVIHQSLIKTSKELMKISKLPLIWKEILDAIVIS